MHSIQKGTLASCEITYFPINSDNYIGDINMVLKIIKSYPVEVEVGILSTTIRGNSEAIFKLVKDVYDTMTGANCNFTINMMLSNICGCQQ
ncbi:MAG: thiamine-binding protein [Clostridiaceae bacterium]|nr:thiamine-binding protein [Clostridiaceae bacterium]